MTSSVIGLDVSKGQIKKSIWLAKRCAATQVLQQQQRQQKNPWRRQQRLPQKHRKKPQLRRLQQRLLRCLTSVQDVVVRETPQPCCTKACKMIWPRAKRSAQASQTVDSLSTAGKTVSGAL